MHRLEGTYYLPGAAHRIAVVAELGPGGWLRIEGQDLRRSWTVDQLQIREPLGGLPCVFTFPDGSRLEAPDEPAIGEWLHECGRRRAGDWSHRLERRWKWVVLSFAVIATGIVLFLWVGLPSAAGWIAPRVPNSVRELAGHQAMLIIQTMLEDSTSIEAQRVSRIEREFAGLVGLRPTTKPHPHLEIRGGGSLGPNALAIPDGTIVLTDELIELAPDSTAILGVLAHELGHLHHDHAMEQVVRASSLPLVITLLTGDLGSGASLAGTVPISLIHNGYSRDAEREADQFALALMQEQNLDPASMAALFDTLEQEYGGLPGWLSTRPANADRIAFFRAASSCRTPGTFPLRDALDVE